MEKFIDILNRIPPYVVIIYLAIFLTLEHFWPHAMNRNGQIKHLLNNAGLLVIATVINVLVSVVLIEWIQYVDKQKYGLMNVFDISMTLKAFAGVIILDFGSYFVHRFLHRSKILWRFHRVHHIEIEMDSSTSFKFHPLEAIITFPALVAVIGLMGISFPAIVLYNAIILPVFFILHSNLKYPRWLESIFSPIFATPAFHRVHHSDEQKFTDSNYGDIFCLWDRVFGTYQKVEPGEIQYGLKEYKDEKTQTFWNMLINPFKK
ncbi:MAG TPA: sterol desaturase family protein [Flavitalea sp.]|nr:sterol desaturase family protein [Flavitalea sp.]